mmetsp:Transcript_59212/g.166071  ORF Transcript_59212/g.166071 Transcript_59212/m.166071 type:complete len:199 (+) Transcript_59212:31-627(+)
MRPCAWKQPAEAARRPMSRPCGGLARACCALQRTCPLAASLRAAAQTHVPEVPPLAEGDARRTGVGLWQTALQDKLKKTGAPFASDMLLKYIRQQVTCEQSRLAGEDASDGKGPCREPEAAAELVKLLQAKCDLTKDDAVSLLEMLGRHGPQCAVDAAAVQLKSTDAGLRWRSHWQALGKAALVEAAAAGEGGCSSAL